MRAILGIDAAWTRSQPSGVALAVEVRGRWRCAGLAPSCADFEALARGVPVDWERARVPVGALDAGRLLTAARRLAPEAKVAVVAVDMPLSLRPITRRRAADDLVSRHFGARACSTHSPTVTRPGRLADDVRAGFGRRGFPLRTADDRSGQTPALIEAYPHTALLGLMGAEYRLPYKVSKTNRYWPGQSVQKRIRNLVTVWQRILGRLGEHVGFEMEIPRKPRSLAALKRYEDGLDALVCAWVGIRFLAGGAKAMGDSEAAIWVG